MTEHLILFLERLADETKPVRSQDLSQLSDLTRGDLGQFRAAWETYSPARRLEVVSAMVEQAEANIHLNFHAILRTCLDDVDGRVRKLAIEGLWEDNKVNLVQPLAAILANDGAPDVRAAAATSLGRYVLMGVLGEIAVEPARLAEKALRTAWERGGEPNEVRRRALESLAYGNPPELHALIETAYYDEDALMRQSALFAMGRSGDTRWANLVLAEMGSPEPEMRYEAAVAAGELALKSGVQALIRRLDDPDATVREAAALALGKIGGQAARRALEAALGSADERLAQAAEEALDELTFNSEQLEGLLMDYPDRNGRSASADLGDEEDLDDDWVDQQDDFLDDDFDEDDPFVQDEDAFGVEAEEDLDWDDEDDDQDWN